MTDAEVLKALEEMAAESEGNFSGKVLDLLQRHQKEIERLQFINSRDNARWKEKHEKALNSIGILWDLYDEKCKQVDRIVEQLEEQKNENGVLAEMDWYGGMSQGFHEAIAIVKEVQNEAIQPAENGGG